MDALEFVANYEKFLDEISTVVRPEFQTNVDELRQIDPHDLVQPDSWFLKESDARGYVWSLFIQSVKKTE